MERDATCRLSRRRFVASEIFPLESSGSNERDNLVRHSTGKRDLRLLDAISAA
jgi:hypothetical protein